MPLQYRIQLAFQAQDRYEEVGRERRRHRFSGIGQSQFAHNLLKKAISLLQGGENILHVDVTHGRWWGRRVGARDF